VFCFFVIVAHKLHINDQRFPEVLIYYYSANLSSTALTKHCRAARATLFARVAKNENISRLLLHNLVRSIKLTCM
jgi:hypothetical protein